MRTRERTPYEKGRKNSVWIDRNESNKGLDGTKKLLVIKIKREREIKEWNRFKIIELKEIYCCNEQISPLEIVTTPTLFDKFLFI